MDYMSAVSALPNQSQPTNSTQVSGRPTEYSDAEAVLLGVLMAILVMAIVFGKLGYCYFRLIDGYLF